MHKKGFRKGPLGYLLQEPTEEAGLIKDDPSLQDKSAPKKEDLVLLCSVREGVTSLTKEKSLVNTLCFLYNGATCVPGTRMYKLQHYLWSQMQSDRPSQRHQPRLLRKRVPLLKELMFLVPEQSAATQTKRPVSTAADRRTVESSPVCSQIIEDCGKDVALGDLYLHNGTMSQQQTHVKSEENVDLNLGPLTLSDFISLDGHTHGTVLDDTQDE
ncbi:hypothetical protein KOW79_015435 [Hemibagrus wyckioides]|uniref:Uncharacterized protein n=1 Tax=Hemibagrus wyckioides TaxID=337641 RepID=A0A9D3SEQ0_9TELE|nr:hypothetical protein KOW79_015435 [Hemibagrus wyckioides]